MNDRTVAVLARLLLISAALLVGAPGSAGAEQQPPPDVMLIVVDTLGARHLGVYDSALKNSPNLRALADSSVTFTRAFSPAPWTKPSLASIFTSLYPKEHGLQRLEAVLSPRIDTVAELLKARGYQTHGIISHTLIQDKYGYDQGFDGYEIVKFSGNVHDSITSQEVVKLALEWIDGKRDRKKPSFLFLHFFDPHFNYQHHPEFSFTDGYQGRLKPGIGFRQLRNRLPKLGEPDFEFLRGLYREEIAYTDSQLGKLFTALKERKLWEKTVLVLTADHGEEFMEHGSIGHTRTLYDELIRVPLIVSFPGFLKSARVDTPVSTIDVVPTIFRAAGLEPSPRFSGVSLVDRASGGKLEVAKLDPKRPLFSEVDFISTGVSANLVGVMRGGEKLVRDRAAANKEEYLDRSTDPAEKASKGEAPADLRKLLDDYSKPVTPPSGAAPTPVPDEAPSSPEEIEQLKSLGYL